jgi:hypothetical protein
MSSQSLVVGAEKKLVTAKVVDIEEAHVRNAQARVDQNCSRKLALLS